jgi:hypothetical protein
MASSDIGVMTVYMDAVTDQFHAGLKKAESAITGFKGQLKNMKRGMSEVNDAIRMASAALELWNAFEKLMTAETYEEINEAWVGVGETMKGMPGELGEMATLIEGILLSITGWGEEIDAIIAKTKENETATDKVVEAYEKYKKLQEGVREEVRELATGQLRYLQIQEMSTKAAADLWKEEQDRGKAMQDTLNERYKVAMGEGKYADLYDKDREKLLEDFDALLEIQMKVAAAEMRLAEGGREVAAAAEKTRIEEEAIELEKKKQLKIMAQIKTAQSGLDRAQEKRGDIKGRGLQGASNTFSSPMGTISLPALNTTVELARQQLTELRAIEQTINGLETTIRDLTKS